MSNDMSNDGFGLGIVLGAGVVLIFLCVAFLVGSLSGEADFERRFCNEFRPTFHIYETGRWECVEAEQ